MEILGRIKEIITDYLVQNDIELVDMMYRRESPGMCLRLLVDKPGGIGLSECEALNNFLSVKLDEEDVIGERYTIEVSSPGLDRPLKTDRDFERVIGRDIEVDTHEPVDDKRHLEGTLIGMERETIVVERDGISTVIPRDRIAFARLKIEF